MEKLTLKCPVRGELKTGKKSKDGLTPTEEYYRVEAIKHLIGVGYPKDNFQIEPLVKKFGASGRNSFRSDFAVLDVRADSIDTSDPDTLLDHALLLCEVKRDTAKADYVKSTQVKPMLDFARKEKCIGLYWDNVEHRVFWQEVKKGKRTIKEGPLSFLPSFGSDVTAMPLTFGDLLPSDSLLDLFNRIEDILHQASFDPSNRYEIILQMLLAKIFDEHAFETRPTFPLEVQDFSVLGVTPRIAKDKFQKLLKRATSYYQKHLPNEVPETLPINGDTLIEILRILAPVKIIHSKRDVVQTFYMKFAKDLYKWDLAQFFTPTTVTDFIVDVLNPQFGEHVADPACGSADFLIAAFRIGRKFNPGYADCVWGVDNSANAVQISVLNMVLNGDGKTNIKKDDSIENVNKYKNKYDILVCNPPFGKKIKETRKNVLKNYALGYDYTHDGKAFVKSKTLLESQETGLLFVEICVKQCKPGGRIGIILPNGYLGNRSNKYRVFREWLLKQTKIVGIVSFPRFTFKSSGADVSASVVFLEKRETALRSIKKDEDYSFAVEMIEKVGWEAGNKRSTEVYKRNVEDGSYIVDEEGDLIIDSDFAEALNRIRIGSATESFSWLSEGQSPVDDEAKWTVNINDVLDDSDYTLDPKRLCRKVTTLRDELKKSDYLLLGDILDFLPEKKSAKGADIKLDPAQKYGYVEIQNIGFGDYHANELRGWELPSRARHYAENGDFYFGSIWGSVIKWCYIGKGVKNLVITNGCHRCRIKKGKEKYLLDLLAYVNTEGWAVQLRSMARGSDGLAEVIAEDAKKVIIPRIKSKTLRKELEPFVDNLKENKVALSSTVSIFLGDKTWGVHEPEKRPSHIVLV